jgi:hypothetical protein
MSCPTDAVLRRHVDAPDARVTAHVGTCDACAGRLTRVRDAAHQAARAIAGLDADAPGVAEVDVAGALRSVHDPRPAAPRSRVPLVVAAGVVAVLVAALVVLTPSGRRAAADLLAGFRSERLQVVTVDPAQPLGEVEALADIVEVDTAGATRSEPRRVDDLDAAAEVAGFTPTAPSSLPAGAELTEVRAAPGSTVRLTFHNDRAPDLPPELDGAQLVVSVPATVAAIYRVDDSMLVVAEAEELAVEASGADLAQIREYLLNRPELPDDLARQLLEIDDWTATLPIPMPVDRVVWQDTTVAGAPGLMLSDPMGAGLLWHADGRIHAVGAEGLDVQALRRIADGID